MLYSIDMNILIVTAHPSSAADTHTIENIYKEAKETKGHTVHIVNLYSDEYKVDFFTFENIRECQKSSVQLKFQEQIQWANEIVMVHPIWWSSVPAIMKNWVDLTIWPGVAYKYSPDGTIIKLLAGKKAKVFATCGGPSWYYNFPFVLPLRTFWETCVFSFCGVELVDIQICGNLDKWKGEKRNNHIQKFFKKIKNS